MFNSFSLNNYSGSKYSTYFAINLNNLLFYFKNLKVSMHEIFSLFGFFTFLVIYFQLCSGIMLSFSLVVEPMLIPIVRDEEDIEDLYTDDFFWMHERGVDLIFIFSYIHLFRKLYLNVFEIETEASWKAGAYSFIIFQGVVFLGLVLCCTHLSEITLTIAANIMHTFFLFTGKFYWLIFTDKQLNTDTLIRLAYLHYVLAFYLAYAGLIHGIDIHYDWKNEMSVDGVNILMFWWDEAFANEIKIFFYLLFMTTVFFYLLFLEPESLSYEIFMWGDIGIVNDVRFYGVAPHWYFRPFMAWLIACPFHKTGIFGLIFFFFVLFFQPNLHGVNENDILNKRFLIKISSKLKRRVNFVTLPKNLEGNFIYQMIFYYFFCCCLYTTSFLPYGRFYNRIGGNWAFIFSYFYIFSYLTFYWFRRPAFIRFYFSNFYHDIYYLQYGEFIEIKDESENLNKKNNENIDNDSAK